MEEIREPGEGEVALAKVGVLLVDEGGGLGAGVGEEMIGVGE